MSIGLDDNHNKYLEGRLNFVKIPMEIIDVIVINNDSSYKHKTDKDAF